MKKSMPDSQEQALTDLRHQEKQFFDSLPDCSYDKTSCKFYKRGWKCLKDCSDLCPEEQGE